MGALLAGPGPDYLVHRGVLLEHLDQFGDPLVGIGHVGVGPDHDLALCPLCPDAPDDAGPAVARQRDHLHVRVVRGGRLQLAEGLVGGAVVDGEQLIAVVAIVHRLGDRSTSASTCLSSLQQGRMTVT